MVVLNLWEVYLKFDVDCTPMAAMGWGQGWKSLAGVCVGLSSTTPKLGTVHAPFVLVATCLELLLEEMEIEQHCSFCTWALPAAVVDM